MKKQKWFRAMSLADEKYVSEADPTAASVRKRSKKKLIFSTIAACASVAIVCGAVWLAMPYKAIDTDIVQYSSSEYYPVIEKLNALKRANESRSLPQYKNNGEKLWNDIKSKFAPKKKGGSDNGDSDVTAATPSNRYPVIYAPTGGEGGNEYREITDNQVEGVIEADLIKRSDKYIFFMDGSSDNIALRVFDICGEKTKEVGRYSFESEETVCYTKRTIYLSDDGNTCTVVSNGYHQISRIIALDVSDPTNISEKARFEIIGDCQTSRITDGSILLLTRYNLRKYDYNDETTFIPQITDKNGTHLISADQIIIPDELTDTQYTMITKLDRDTLDVKDCVAFLSYSGQPYITKDRIYLSREYYSTQTENDEEYCKCLTDISCIAYGSDSFEQLGSVTVSGYIKDQWSMDEYDGILRIVATTTTRDSTNASLYCIDRESFKVVASVIDFAPPGEDVKSVRFDKSAAYVCTSIRNTDPVFFFDLSDLNNITRKDTGTIDGFSSSLINFGDYLIGIGQSSPGVLKIEVYEEIEDGVRSVDKYERTAECSSDYKSYYIDREHSLIGLGINALDTPDDESAKKYLVLCFDGSELSELADVPLDGFAAFKRGVYIDGYMYMFGKDCFKVVKLDI